MQDSGFNDDNLGYMDLPFSLNPMEEEANKTGTKNTKKVHRAGATIVVKDDNKMPTLVRLIVVAGLAALVTTFAVAAPVEMLNLENVLNAGVADSVRSVLEKLAR